jgi:signal peptidase I
MKKLLNDWIYPIAIALILALLIKRFLFYNIYVPSGSMIPTIMIGDRILVTKSYNKDNIKRGDIVVFQSDERNELLIKRVIGLPGEKVEIKSDGSVFIDGNVIEEPYVVNKDPKTGSFNVPQHHYLFLGDNRANSRDARYWVNPYISEDAIKGKARIIVFPFKRFGSLK